MRGSIVLEVYRRGMKVERTTRRGALSTLRGKKSGITAQRNLTTRVDIVYVTIVNYVQDCGIRSSGCKI